MKQLTIYMVFMCAMVSSTQISAYIFTFSNHTDYPVPVRMQLTADTQWYDVMLPPRRAGLAATHDFRFTSLFDSSSLNGWKLGFCLEKVQVREPIIVRKETVDDDGETKFTYEQDQDPKTKEPMFGGWKNVIVTFMQNEAYNKITSAGASFAQDLAGAATTAASVGTGIPIPEVRVSGFASAIGEFIKYSWCKDRHFDIVEDIVDEKNPTKIVVKFITEAR